MRITLILFFLSASLMSCNQPGSQKISEQENAQPPFTPATACLLDEISYCTHAEDSLKKYLPAWKMVWNPAPLNGTYAFVATDGTSYAVAIRGSVIQFSWAAFDNWIYQDLNVATQKDWPHTDSAGLAKVSEGVYDAWQNLCLLKDTVLHKTLWQLLDSVTNRDTPLFITGHSLGGNLATVYASWLVSRFKTEGHSKKNMNVITFAAPAAGNTLFAADFNKKFPASMRYENTNDMVPKFPVASNVGNLGSLYSPAPAASEISVGYKFLTIKMSTFFTTVDFALRALEVSNGNSVYTQTNGPGIAITVPLSGKNKTNDILSWFAEAAYQHSLAQYAAHLGAPVINAE